MTDTTYHFRFEDGRTERVHLSFPIPMRLGEHSEREWTALSFMRCGHCPLPDGGHCPFATGLAPFVDRFDDVFSYERVEVAVVTGRRTITAQVALQHGLASVIGLVGATSGCPHLTFFRPMAHFHLPFASEEETLVRAFAMHLLGEWVGGKPLGLDDLMENYKAAARANHDMADRLRAVLKKDAVVNALITLDTFAQAVPYVIDEKLAELAYIFEE